MLYVRLPRGLVTFKFCLEKNQTKSKSHLKSAKRSKFDQVRQNSDKWFFDIGVIVGLFAYMNLANSKQNIRFAKLLTKI